MAQARGFVFHNFEVIFGYCVENIIFMQNTFLATKNEQGGPDKCVTAGQHRLFNLTAVPPGQTVPICDNVLGFVTNEATLGIPCHATDLSSFRAHLESLMSEYGIVTRTELVTSSDEMELFGTVNRHFKNMFNRQLECMQFYLYDNVPEGELNKFCNYYWNIGVIVYINNSQQKRSAVDQSKLL